MDCTFVGVSKRTVKYITNFSLFSKINITDERDEFKTIHHIFLS